MLPRLLLVASLAATLAAPTSRALAQSAPARPGDRVLIRIHQDTTREHTVWLDPAGVAVLPLAGDVRLGGVAGDAIQDTVRARLASYVNPATVEAMLLRRLGIGGAVERPGVYYVDWTYTVRDAIAMAGGVTALGREREVMLERGGTSQELRDWRLGASGSLPIESGDQLIVRRLPWYQRNAVTIATTVGVLMSLIIAFTR